MKYPRYNVDVFSGGFYQFTTKCPFGIIGKTKEIIMVGSKACQLCLYYKGKKKDDNIVFCSIK